MLDKSGSHVDEQGRLSLDFGKDLLDIATIDKNAVVTQSNDIIKGQFRVTNAQFRIFFTVVSLIKKRDNGEKYYPVKISSIKEIAGLKGNDIYNRIKKEVTGMFGKVVTIRKEGKSEHYPLIRSARYDSEDKVVLIRLEADLLPYFRDIQNKWTKAKLDVLLSFNTVYIAKFYLLLKQWDNSPSRSCTITLDDIVFTLNLPASYEYYDIKRNVIEKAQKKFKKVGLPFSWEPKKEGNKVYGIFVKLLKKGEEAPDPVKALPGKTDETKGLEILLSADLTEFQARTIVSKVAFKDIAKTVYDAKTAKRDNKIKTNLAAYTVSLFKKKYGIEF